VKRKRKLTPGKISLDEFKAGGKDSLPVIGDFKDLGHHYDEESEYFLHHEELFHSTPETQTDDSYTHPEDLAHFRHHEHIEAEEDARERKFEGLAPDADLGEEHKAFDPLAAAAHAPGDGPEAYKQAGQGPDVGGGQTWEEQTAEGGGEGAPAGVAGQAEKHGTPQEGGAAPVEVDAGKAQNEGYQQARFRDARAARKVPPRRLGPDVGHKQHRASAEERARADAPYSESARRICQGGTCEGEYDGEYDEQGVAYQCGRSEAAHREVTLTPRVQDARRAALGRVLDRLHACVLSV
jgi:hypothetical protein